MITENEAKKFATEWLIPILEEASEKGYPMKAFRPLLQDYIKEELKIIDNKSETNYYHFLSLLRKDPRFIIPEKAGNIRLNKEMTEETTTTVEEVKLTSTQSKEEGKTSSVPAEPTEELPISKKTLEKFIKQMDYLNKSNRMNFSRFSSTEVSLSVEEMRILINYYKLSDRVTATNSGKRIHLNNWRLLYNKIKDSLVEKWEKEEKKAIPISTPEKKEEKITTPISTPTTAAPKKEEKKEITTPTSTPISTPSIDLSNSSRDEVWKIIEKYFKTELTTKGIIEDKELPNWSLYFGKISPKEILEKFEINSVSFDPKTNKFSKSNERVYYMLKDRVDALKKYGAPSTNRVTTVTTAAKENPTNSTINSSMTIFEDYLLRTFKTNKKLFYKKVSIVGASIYECQMQLTILLKRDDLTQIDKIIEWKNLLEIGSDPKTKYIGSEEFQLQITIKRPWGPNEYQFYRSCLLMVEK